LLSTVFGFGFSVADCVRSPDLFRVDLTVLERGQQWKRWKEFFDAEQQETKQGVAGGKAKPKLSNDLTNEQSAVVPTFVKDIAEKTKTSERTIQHEVQIATRIPEKVQTIIKDLPVADNKSDLLKLSRLIER
jgi:hypothetical protein